MINFLAEISKSFDSLILPTPSSKYNKQYNIYELDIRKPPVDSYWLDWGGHYNNFVGSDIEIYYTTFLEKLDTNIAYLNDVLKESYSMKIIDGIVYFNTPQHPWLYPDYTAESRTVYPFLYSVINPDNPSNNIINDTPAQIRLELPNTNIKLSDSFNGITLNQGFNLTLINNDSYFDNEDDWNLFNTPVYLKKSIKDNPTYYDFKDIRCGIIDNTITSFNSFQISIADKLRAMEEPVCNVITEKSYDVTIDNDALGKSIPVIYGTKTVELIKLNSTSYIAAEKITSVSNIYNKDGAVIAANLYTPNYTTGIITSTTELKTAKVTGYTDNRIGVIIKDLVVNKAQVSFNNTNFNESEINQYINISPSINIEINSGDVKKAIGDILKSDMAYFFPQLDGRLTIRRYGTTYATHNIPSRVLTQVKEKSYDKAQEYYFSSCVVNYNFIDKDNYSSYLFNRDNEAENKYKKKVLKTFDTDLTNSTYASAFATLLSNRYVYLKQKITVGIGQDTSSMNLLDTIILDLNINDRKFSNATKFIITEINPSQDTLTLEEI